MEINQTFQKLSKEDILSKKSYPVWFFTNERFGNFFKKIESKGNLRKVFSIGGGGDFAFLLLSSKLLSIENICICDVRQMANISIDLKISLYKKFKLNEIIDIFILNKYFNKYEIYKKIEAVINPVTKDILEYIFTKINVDNFLKCIKKTKLWYRHSFWQIKQRSDYLPYLLSENSYTLLQNNLDKISICAGDFNENIKFFNNNYFDLIYTSNIFDSVNYCKNPKEYLKTIYDKLNNDGFMFITTQDNPKIITKLIEHSGFKLIEKERHNFNIISSILGHYSYSFLLFKKTI